MDQHLKYKGSKKIQRNHGYYTRKLFDIKCTEPVNMKTYPNTQIHDGKNHKQIPN